MAQENLDLSKNIEEKAKASGATYDLLKDDVDDKDLEKVEPKGEKETIDLDDDGDEKDDKKAGSEKDEDKDEKDDKVDDADLQISIPRNKEILAKYPTLFKDFPHLRSGLIKLEKFYEVFPSIAEANEAIEKIKSFEEFENTIISGDLTTTLKQVAENNGDAFGKIVDNYLPSLQKVNEKAYYHILSGVYKNAVVEMVEEAKKSNDENLQTAANIFYRFIFGKSEWNPHTKFGPSDQKDEKQEKFDSERAAYIEQRFNDAKSDLSSRVENIVESTITENIDPKGQMTDYVKKVAIRQVKEELDKIVGNDESFKKVIDNLWKRAGDENFSQQSRDKIKGAWLSKARVHLKDLIQKARKDALEGLGKRVREEKSDREERRDDAAPRKRSNDDSPNPPKKYEKTVDFFLRD